VDGECSGGDKEGGPWDVHCELDQNGIFRSWRVSHSGTFEAGTSSSLGLTPESSL
jgi:hypothetical protein